MSIRETQKRYNASNIKRIPLDMQKQFYIDVLKPAADSKGEPVNTFIKNSVMSRISQEDHKEHEIPPEVIVNLIKWLREHGHTDQEIVECLHSFADPIDDN